MSCPRTQHRNNVPILRGEKHYISLKILHQARFETARQAVTVLFHPCGWPIFMLPGYCEGYIVIYPFRMYYTTEPTKCLKDESRTPLNSKTYPLTQQTRGIDAMLCHCWSTVYDAGPTMTEHCINAFFARLSNTQLSHELTGELWSLFGQHTTFMTCLHNTDNYL